MPRWLFYTFLTMLLWGGWGFLSKPASNALSGWEVQTLSTLGLLPVILVLLLSKKTRAGGNQRAGFWLAFASGVIGSVGNVAYFQSLGMGAKAAAVTPLTALYPIVTIGLALVLLKERLNRIQAIGALLSLAAVYCFNVGSGSGLLTPWLALALVPIALWGLTGFLQKLATGKVSAELATVAFLIGELPMALITPFFVTVGWQVSAWTWAVLIGLGILFSLGNLTSILAFGSGGKASIVTPLASLYSVVTIPLAVLLLNERVSAREGAGIALAVAAVAALSWEKSPAAAAAPVEPNPS